MAKKHTLLASVTTERSKSVCANASRRQAKMLSGSTESVLPLHGFVRWFMSKRIRGLFAPLTQEIVTDPRFLFQLNDRQKGLFVWVLHAAYMTQNNAPADPRYYKRAYSLTQNVTLIKTDLERLCNVFDTFVKWPSNASGKPQFIKLKHYLALQKSSVVEEEEEIEEDIDKDRESKPTRLTVFHPPTLEAVTDAFKTLIESNPHRWPLAPTYEAEQFFHHYESNGWKVSGRAPMRKWQSAVRTWLARGRTFSQHTPSNPPRPSYDQSVMRPSGERFLTMPPPAFTELVRKIATPTQDAR